jgi:hypothetical protein
VDDEVFCYLNTAHAASASIVYALIIYCSNVMIAREHETVIDAHRAGAIQVQLIVRVSDASAASVLMCCKGEL